MSSIQLWPDKEANTIVKQHGDQDTYVFETGFGPSGKPHFGTFGEVVRTNYVMLAMKDKGYKTKLIAFSDDLDGLRKVPEGFPDWLKDYIGKPVSSIPDPFDTHESFSAHMNALLVDMLTELGLEFEFRSSVEAYNSGTFNDQITMVIQNYEAVQDIIFPYLREETKEHWFPFFPICENCGRVGNTRVVGVDKENLLVEYVCDREFGKQAGCGHKGTINPLNGAGKLQWKVDWPARWHAFGVHYEMFGKDLIESAEVGDRIVQRIFRSKPPSHMFYEMFLDENGQKISKSVGKGMTAEQWQEYGTQDSLMYLMLDKPREAKRLYPGVIPHYMSLTQKGADAYYNDGEDRAKRHYQYIHLFDPSSEPPVLVDYSTLVNLVGNVGIQDAEIAEDYLRRSGLLSETLSNTQTADLHRLINKAKRFYDEQMRFDADLSLDAEDGFLLGKLTSYLKDAEHDADTLHNELFQIPKAYGVEPRKFFRALYTALIKQERGPRGGQFIKLLGQDKAAELIEQRIREYSQVDDEIEQDTDDAATATTLPLAIDSTVSKQYPDLHIGAAILRDVDIKDKRSKELDAAITEAVNMYQTIDFDAAISSGAISAYRQLFESFGTNPNAMPPSPENILRIAVQNNRLPNVNTLVDATNLTVLETGVSVAVYDLDKLQLPLVLRFAHEEDQHQALGQKQTESVPEGELVYADEREVICRALNHRDSDRTKVTGKTRNILLIVDGAPEIGVETLLNALHANIARIQQYAGGEVATQGLLL